MQVIAGSALSEKRMNFAKYAHTSKTYNFIQSLITNTNYCMCIMTRSECLIKAKTSVICAKYSEKMANRFGPILPNFVKKCKFWGSIATLRYSSKILKKKSQHFWGPKEQYKTHGARILRKECFLSHPTIQYY